MQIQNLIDEAFLVANQENATTAIDEARSVVRREGKVGAFNFELVVPERPDDAWLRENLVRPLVYFCQSRGATLPSCSGVFASIFHGGHIYFVLAAEVIAWAEEGLGLDEDELIARYGTGETETAPPP